MDPNRPLRNYSIAGMWSSFVAQHAYLHFNTEGATNSANQELLFAKASFSLDRRLVWSTRGTVFIVRRVADRWRAVCLSLLLLNDLWIISRVGGTDVIIAAHALPLLQVVYIHTILSSIYWRARMQSFPPHFLLDCIAAANAYIEMAFMPPMLYPFGLPYPFFIYVNGVHTPLSFNMTRTFSKISLFDELFFKKPLNYKFKNVRLCHSHFCYVNVYHCF